MATSTHVVTSCLSPLSAGDAKEKSRDQVFVGVRSSDSRTRLEGRAYWQRRLYLNEIFAISHVLFLRFCCDEVCVLCFDLWCFNLSSVLI